MRTVATLLAAATLALLLAPRGAEAIPAFARKYRMSCTTCHAPFPRLKAFGDEFAGRGFSMEAGQEPARAAIDAGDDLLSLPRDFPLAVRFDGHVEWEPERDPQVDLRTPFVVKALSGGRIAEKVGYYAYFIIENGGEEMKIEDAWVQVVDVLGLPIDLTLGQFQICDPVAKRELRLTREDYEILGVRPGLSGVNLTYDRGLLLGWRAPLGVDVIGMVTNGNGIGSGGATFDDDRYMTFTLYVTAPIGPVQLGFLGQAGKALDAGSGILNTTVFWGPDVKLELGEHVSIAAQWLSRHDSNGFFDPANTGETNTRGGWVEVVWLPGGENGRTSVAVLGNRVVSDDPLAERESAAVAAGWLFRRNVRLVGEARWDAKAEEARVSLGTIVAY